MKKTVYITGADRGLGLALSKQFLSSNYKVFAGSYMPDWHELTELKEQHPHDLDMISLDVTNQQSVADAAAYIKEQAGKLDILVNNAAIFLDRPGNIFGQFDYEAMIKMFDTNTLGPLRVSKSVIPLILKGNEKILANISSEAGSVTDSWREKEYGYSMSKAALNMELSILQSQVKEHGIKVLAFHPGWVKTYITGEFLDEATITAEESAAGIVKQIIRKPLIEEHMFIDYQGNKMNW